MSKIILLQNPTQKKSVSQSTPSVIVISVCFVGFAGYVWCGISVQCDKTIQIIGCTPGRNSK